MGGEVEKEEGGGRYRRRVGKSAGYGEKKERGRGNGEGGRWDGGKEGGRG